MITQIRERERRPTAVTAPSTEHQQWPSPEDASAVPALRYPSLRRLLSELPADFPTLTIAHASINTNGTPVTITEELRRTPPALLLAAVRSPLNNTTAGNLLEWRVHTTGPGPRHTRRTSYAVSMPTPLAARTFDLESYFLVPSEMPAALSARGAVCFVSQTPLDPTPAHAPGSAAAGDVLFSATSAPRRGCTWLRRVARRDERALLARSIERAALRATIRANHQFMDMPTAAHLAALQAIVDGDRAYQRSLPARGRRLRRCRRRRRVQADRLGGRCGPHRRCARHECCATPHRPCLRRRLRCQEAELVPQAPCSRARCAAAAGACSPRSACSSTRHGGSGRALRRA